MKNISIRRCSGQDADLYQGVIEPEDGSWRLFLDKEGFPHLVIRTNVEDDDGKIVNGYLNLDAVLPEGTSIKDLMLSTFGGQVPDGEVGEFRPEDVDFGPLPHLSNQGRSRSKRVFVFGLGEGGGKYFHPLRPFVTDSVLCTRPAAAILHKTEDTAEGSKSRAVGSRLSAWVIWVAVLPGSSRTARRIRSRVFIEPASRVSSGGLCGLGSPSGGRA